MSLGCYINIDSFSEIEMISKLPKSLVKKSTFGVRVNPVIGAGSIGVTSTAAAGSKFGIELSHGAKEKLI
jgi:diaminopimelate decarboxylase